MRVILGEIHRRKILSFLPPGGHLLEWGAGGSTVWFANNLPEGARLTSVEHNPTWRSLVQGELGSRPDVRLLLHEASHPFGRKDSRDEENAGPFTSYIHTVDGEQFDVIFVDGMARSACMDAARALLKPNGVLFLHDSQRSWYDEAKNLYHNWGTIGSCADYPGPNLWFGGLGPAAPDAIGPIERRMPVVVSYYTLDTPYAEEVQTLIRSCERLGLEHDIVGLPASDSWEENCARKAKVCLDAWRRRRCPIVWIDADAEVRAPFTLLETCTADFGIHRWNGYQFASGTLFFNQTPLAEQLLERWVERCRAEPQVIDQALLDLAWEELVAVSPLDTCWLPQGYCQIFDAAPDPQQSVVVLHNQASRRFKTEVTRVAPRPSPQPSAALLRARTAGRPRRWFLPRPDALDYQAEVEQERRLDQLLSGPSYDRTGAKPAGTRPEGWWCSTAIIDEAHRREELKLVDACLADVEAEVSRAREAILEERMAELANRLRQQSPPSFAIYGAGIVGQALLRATRRLGLIPTCFVETMPREPDLVESGVPIWSVDKSLAARCHCYLIGSFGSTTVMLAHLERLYTGTGFRYEALVPSGPAPSLPEVGRAARTLLASRTALAQGRGIADGLYLM